VRTGKGNDKGYPKLSLLSEKNNLPYLLSIESNNTFENFIYPRTNLRIIVQKADFKTLKYKKAKFNFRRLLFRQ
jgi:hypothetical protein